MTTTAAAHPPIALVTGANSGIGLALVTELRQQGYLVIGTARHTEGLAQIEATGAIAMHLDVDEEASRQHLVQQLKQAYGRLDLLINNAGFGLMGPVLDLTEAQWHSQWQTNVIAVARLSSLCLTLLQQAPLRHGWHGQIVMIGSVSATMVTPFAGAYCASKAALHGLAEAMAMELLPLQVAVKLVVTGAVATGFAHRASEELHWLSAQSPWWLYREGILRRAKASQDFPISACEYAKQLVPKLREPSAGFYLYIGRGSRVLPALKRWLPRRWLWRVLARKFGL